MNGRVWSVAVTALLTVGLAGPAAAAGGGTWAQAGYGPGNTGYNAYESVVNAKSVGKLKANWSVTLTGAGETSCIGPKPPVVSGGRVFLPEADGVSAFHELTGKKLWSNPTAFDEGYGPGLAVSGGTLIGASNFCFSNSDSDGDLLALDTKTGTEKWSAERDTPYDNLVVDKGLVITSGEEFAADYGAVTAYRLSTGAVKWERKDVQAANGVSAGGRLLVWKSDGTGSLGLSASTGAQLWSTKAKWAVQGANPAGDRFYVTDDDESLIAVRATTGAKTWTVPDAAGLVSNDGRHVFVARGSVLTAYAASNGKKRWSRNLGGWVGRPIRAGGLVYATVAGRPLAILNAATGTTVTSGAKYDYAEWNPVVAGGRVYLLDGSQVRTYTP